MTMYFVCNDCGCRMEAIEHYDGYYPEGRVLDDEVFCEECWPRHAPPPKPPSPVLLGPPTLMEYRMMEAIESLNSARYDTLCELFPSIFTDGETTPADKKSN